MLPSKKGWPKQPTPRIFWLPTQDCKLEVKRGDETNVAIKWNETENKWQ
jgi:hypothetical protein